MYHFSSNKIKTETISLVSGSLIALLFLSGQFTLSRVGGLDFNVGYILLFAAILWAFIIHHKVIIVKINKKDLINFIAILSLPILIALTSLWSLDVSHASSKLHDLFFICIYMIFSFLIISRDPDSIKFIVYTFLLFALAYSLLALVHLTFFGASRGTIQIGGPNVATRVMFFGVIASLFLYSKNKSSLLFFSIIIIFAGIIAIGSRGGIVAAFFSLLLFLSIQTVNHIMKRIVVPRLILINFWHARLSLLGSIKFLSLSALIVILSKLVLAVFESRVVNLLINRLHYAGRDRIYENFILIFLDNPTFGVGLGGHASYGWSYYPHNLFIELAVDGGVFLLFLSILYFSLVFVIFKKKWKNGKYFSIAAIYVLVAQQFSGGYFDFRYFFLFSMLAVLYRPVSWRLP